MYKNDTDENETADDLDAYAYADNIGNTFSEDDETVISCNFILLSSHSTLFTCCDLKGVCLINDECA